MNIIIRPASLNDTRDVARVLCESRDEFVAFAPMVHTRDEVYGWMEDVLIPGGGVHVATCAGEVVAMLAISREQGHGWIDQLYVQPGATGSGIGAQLLRAAHARLPPPIRLYTFQANAGARRFYERYGYRAIAFTDGSCNEERCPDVLYEWRPDDAAAGSCS